MTELTSMGDDASLPTTDAASLERLKRFGGGKLLGEMISLFISAGAGAHRAARAGLESNDAKATEMALHALKSSSAQLGAMRMQRLSEQGETSRAPARSTASIGSCRTSKRNSPRAELARARSSTRGRMNTVAVVEDNADNRLLLQAILDGLYDVVEYENGVDALAGLAAKAARSRAARHLAARHGRQRDPRAHSRRRAAAPPARDRAHRARHGRRPREVSHGGLQRLHHEAHRGRVAAAERHGEVDRRWPRWSI